MLFLLNNNRIILRISITNKHAMVKIKKKEIADDYRKKLRNIDRDIVFKVYSGLDVITYRETHGIDAV